MPNGAYQHLLINHIPVILAPLGAIALLLAAVTHRRAVWMFGLASVTLAGLSAYPVMATGDEAEEIVEHRPGVNRHLVHDHQEAGELAMWTLLAAGAVAAYGWWRLANTATRSNVAPDAALPPVLRGVIVLLALGAAGTTAYASLRGGYIMHPEAHGAGAENTPTAPGPSATSTPAQSPAPAR